MCRDNAVVYRDLQAKSLNVRDGMHYGADFAIYEGSDREAHSYALVHVKHEGQEIAANALVRWTRVAAAAKKKCVCTADARLDMSQAILALVDCRSATVKYAYINRLRLR